MTARGTVGDSRERQAPDLGEEVSRPRPVAARPDAEHEARRSIPADEAASVQRALTVLAPLDPAKSRAALEALLDRIGQNIPGNGEIDFEALTSVHFMRWVIVPAERATDGTPAGADALVMSTNFDGELAPHLEELVTRSGPGFDKIFSFCKGYRPASKDERIRFLETHSVPVSTFYVGVPSRTRAQIVHEAKLRRALEEYLDGRDLGGDPEAVASALRTYVRSAGLSQAPPPRNLWPRRLRALRRVWSLFPDLFQLLFSLSTFRRLEDTDEERLPEATRAEMDHTEMLVANEDRGGLLQNQLTHLVSIKAGPLRLATIRLVLGAIGLLADLIYVNGKLGEIPTIHFARWVLVDEGRRVLFFSNFDGSWENYLGDFIDKAAKGLTSIWSNTVGFPRTTFLLWNGARDEQRFKTWTRASQLPTQIWYSAYPDLTLRDITANLEIREGLFRENGDLEWLTRL